MMKKTLILLLAILSASCTTVYQRKPFYSMWPQCNNMYYTIYELRECNRGAEDRARNQAYHMGNNAFQRGLNGR